MSGPGIANATRTRIDSASKHQVACRVDYEHMLSWINYDHVVMQREKMKWCMEIEERVALEDLKAQKYEDPDTG